MTKPDAKADAAPEGAASVAELPSQVSEDGWVPAQHLETAIVARLGGPLPDEARRQIMPAMGLPKVALRYADSITAFRHRTIVQRQLVGKRTDEGMGPDHGTGGRYRPEMAFLKEEPQPWDTPKVRGRARVDWTKGVLFVERSYLLLVDPETGQPMEDNRRGSDQIVRETVFLSVGPVEIEWDGVVALLPPGAAEERGGAASVAASPRASSPRRMDQMIGTGDVPKPLPRGQDPAFQTKADNWVKLFAANPKSGKPLHRDSALARCMDDTKCTHAQAEKAWRNYALRRGRGGRPRATPDGGP